MRKILASLLTSTVVLACSSSGGGGSASTFAGTYSCTGNETLTYTAPVGTPSRSIAATTVDTITANTDGTISASEVTDGGAACVLKFDTSGNSATLVAGQTCATGGITLTYTSGSASVSGSNLNANINFTFTGQVNGVTVAGSGGASSSCTRM